jgi:uncharacterized protein (TIGR02594 family)
MRWMEIAWTQQGIRETPGAAATPEIVAMFRDAGHPHVVSDEVAWCAAFAGACLERSGITSTRSLRARSYLTLGTKIDAPRVGAIVVLKRDEAGPTAGHVGFVTGWTGTTVAVLGGNQANAVTVAHFQRADVLGYRWPEPPASAPDLAAAGSRTVGAAIGQVRDAGRAALVLASGAGASAVAPDAGALGRQIVGGATELVSTASAMERAALFAIGKWHWVAIALAGWFLARIALAAGWITEARVEDHNTGNNPTREKPE